MNLIADLLFFAAALGLGYAATLAVARLPFFPLREVVVAGPLQEVTPTQIEYAARNAVAGNFFTVNLDAVRAAFEKLPWVRKAEVRRRWPDGLELAIEEHVAAARWKHAEGAEARLVNREGEVFAAASNAELPLFVGPEGSAPRSWRATTSCSRCSRRSAGSRRAWRSARARPGSCGWTTACCWIWAATRPSRA
jgi:cell division protein FtsQ